MGLPTLSSTPLGFHKKRARRTLGSCRLSTEGVRTTKVLWTAAGVQSIIRGAGQWQDWGEIKRVGSGQRRTDEVFKFYEGRCGHNV